jgi:extracellular elastinolytic metalloproteinase
MHLLTRGRRLAVLMVLGAVALALPVVASAAQKENASKRDKLAFFDSRATPAAKITLRKAATVLADAPSAAVAALRDSLGDQGIVDIDPLTGTPRMVGRLDGFLTDASSAAATDIALGFVQRNAAAFGVDAHAIGNFQLVRDYVSIDGTHHLYYLQKVNGVPVFGNGLRANVTADGRLVNVLGSPVANLSGVSTSPQIAAGAAVGSARHDAAQSIVPVPSIGGSDTRQTTVFSNGDKASLVLFQGIAGTRLAWQTIVSAPGASYLHVVDATTGAVLYRRSLTNYGNALVFENYPGAPIGGVAALQSLNQPGWTTSSSILTGNNAHVYSDVNDDNIANPTEEVPASDGSGNFVYPLTPFEFGPSLDSAYGCAVTSPCTYDPTGFFSWQVNRAQTSTQLYYFLNRYHDHLAAAPIGFNEAAGNFQVTNSSGLGVGGDAVAGQSIDGADTLCCISGNTVGLPDPLHTDNANMATPPDGISPTMQMYLWHDPLTDFTTGDPTADPFLPSSGSDEADIVFHEYTHGLSNRLVVDSLGNSTLGNIQAGAMGEAWSDFYAIDYLVNLGKFVDTGADGEMRLGPYVGKNLDLLRTEPMDCSVGSTSSACPGDLDHAGGYTYGDFGRIIGRPEVHADGEIWGQTLWDLRSKLGSARTEALVTRGMELAPDNPSFLDMRNAIVQASLISGGAKLGKIWAVFARRGMGFFAGAVDGDDTSPVENFSLPPTPGAPRGKLTGSVTDQDTGLPLGGVVIGFGGHDSGFPGDFVGVSKSDGSYKIKGVFTGTYPKVSASAPGYNGAVSSVTVSGTKNFTLRRDWAALAGGGSITGFTGPDLSGFACGPTAAIDQSQGTGWGSTTDDNDGNATGFITPKSVTIRLPVPVNVAAIAIDPGATCGDAGSSSTKDYMLETSTNGTTWTLQHTAMFDRSSRGVLNSVPLDVPASLGAVRYVRFTELNPQVPYSSDNSLPPFGSEAVSTECGPGNGNAYTGCQFMDMSELEVFGALTGP